MITITMPEWFLNFIAGAALLIALLKVATLWLQIKIDKVNKILEKQQDEIIKYTREQL